MREALEMKIRDEREDAMLGNEKGVKVYAFEIGEPKLQIFKTCEHFIRTLPSLVYSQTDVEDVDTAQEDHLYDQCRYVCMKRRISPPVVKEEPRNTFDPLGQRTPTYYGY